MTFREELAAAVTAVDGVHCTPFPRQETKPGQAFIRLDHIDYPDNFGGIGTWQVLVMLPQALDAAEKAIESQLPQLHAAISEHMFIRRAAHQELVYPDSASVQALVIEGTREI